MLSSELNAKFAALAATKHRFVAEHPARTHGLGFEALSGSWLLDGEQVEFTFHPLDPTASPLDDDVQGAVIMKVIRRELYKVVHVGTFDWLRDAESSARASFEATGWRDVRDAMVHPRLAN